MWLAMIVYFLKDKSVGNSNDPPGLAAKRSGWGFGAAPDNDQANGASRFSTLSMMAAHLLRYYAAHQKPATAFTGAAARWPSQSQIRHVAAFSISFPLSPKRRLHDYQCPSALLQNMQTVALCTPE